MNLKSACLCGVLGTLLGLGAARGQDLHDPTGGFEPTYNTLPGAAGAAPAPTQAKLSQWILHGGPDCCGPLGGAPIRSELYIRTGPSLPVEGGGRFEDVLSAGWDAQAGGRLLLYNQTADKAWTIDLSLSQHYNQGRNADMTFLLENIPVQISNPNNPGNNTTIILPEIDVTVQNLRRTYVTLGFGREWYLRGSGWSDTERAWRWGVDAGARWGTAKLNLHEIRHLTDEIYGPYAAVHSDVEWPWRCCMISLGFRAEWDYTFMDILQPHNNTHVIDVNLLLTAGIRF